MLGPTLVITGTVNAEEDLDVHGTVHGTVSAPAHCVRVALDAKVEADVLARDITVLGQATGRLTATEIVDVRASARVQGHIASPTASRRAASTPRCARRNIASSGSGFPDCRGNDLMIQR